MEFALPLIDFAFSIVDKSITVVCCIVTQIQPLKWTAVETLMTQNHL